MLDQKRPNEWLETYISTLEQSQSDPFASLRLRSFIREITHRIWSLPLTSSSKTKDQLEQFADYLGAVGKAESHPLSFALVRYLKSLSHVYAQTDVPSPTVSSILDTLTADTGKTQWMGTFEHTTDFYGSLMILSPFENYRRATGMYLERMLDFPFRPRESSVNITALFDYQQRRNVALGTVLTSFELSKDTL